jgi:membrane-bound ClpP family serine protease
MIIYIACLALGLLFTMVSAVAGHFFGGHDHVGGDLGTGGHAEAGYDHSGVPGISFFSPTVLSCFVTAFGACGIILTKVGSPVWVSAPISAVAGVIMAGLAFLLFHWMFQQTQSSSESKVSSLVGQTASIITPIPENGVGQIAYVQGGSRYNAPARTENGTPVGSGKLVRITRIVGTDFFVELLAAEKASTPSLTKT